MFVLATSQTTLTSLIVDPILGNIIHTLFLPLKVKAITTPIQELRRQASTIQSNRLDTTITTTTIIIEGYY